MLPFSQCREQSHRDPFCSRSVVAPETISQTGLGPNAGKARKNVSLELTRARKCDTMCHMRTITIRQLHEATGRWVRRAAEGEIHVTERGRLIAKILPAKAAPAKVFFANPKYTRAYLAQRKNLQGGTDSTRIIGEERDSQVK